MTKLLSWLWGALRTVLLFLAWLWFFLEEWGWHPLAAWLGRFTRWPPWARLEARIAQAPPRWAVTLFLIPVVALFPVKMLALWLLHTGHTMLGVAVVLGTKVIGTAIGGRLYVLTEPQLMQMPRFARLITWWRETRLRVRQALDDLVPRAGLRAWWRMWRARLRALFH